MVKFLGYEFKTHYHIGKQNYVADSLLWREDSPLLLAISGPKMVIWEEIQAKTQICPHCTEIK